MVDILYLIRWGSVVRVHSILPIKAIKYDCFYFFITPTLCSKNTQNEVLHQGDPVRKRPTRFRKAQTSSAIHSPPNPTFAPYKVGVGVRYATSCWRCAGTFASPLNPTRGNRVDVSALFFYSSPPQNEQREYKKLRWFESTQSYH